MSDIQTLRGYIRNAEIKIERCETLRSNLEIFIEELETKKKEITGETAVKGEFSQSFFENNSSMRQISDYEKDLSRSHKLFQDGYSAGFDSFDFFDSPREEEKGLAQYLTLINEDIENIKAAYKSLVEKLDVKINDAKSKLAIVNSEISGIRRSISSWQYQIEQLEKSEQ